MYTPKHFLSPAKETLLKILPEASFATLVTSDEDGLPLATHLPLSYNPDAGESGTIRGHMARANPHWKLLAGRQSLIIFSGPHLYVSPRDYASKVNVPTWNYVAVHAYGQVNLLEDAVIVRGVLETLTAENEQGRPVPWNLSEIEEKRSSAMMKAIVAFEMPVARLEGKAKLGQNKSVEDRAALESAAHGTELAPWQRFVSMD
ncbi:MAG: FMN-binding negative transcriptional regulator [Sneathiella sp.]|nr:FMN-binding negative transcriptional regulator [Sneathiella sp.]